MAGELNLPISAGATRRVSFTVTAGGQPEDFTGATVTFSCETMSKELTQAGPVLTLTLTPDDTEQMWGGKYVIDVRWESGDVTRLLTGRLVVSRPPRRVAT